LSTQNASDRPAASEAARWILETCRLSMQWIGSSLLASKDQQIKLVLVCSSFFLPFTSRITDNDRRGPLRAWRIFDLIESKKDFYQSPWPRLPPSRDLLASSESCRGIDTNGRSAQLSSRFSLIFHRCIRRSTRLGSSLKILM
jgi:hypothetical protein